MIHTAPFKIGNHLDTEWQYVSLSFDDWDWMAAHYGESFEGYYLNGYGVQGIVMAARLHAGLPLDEDGMDYNSEGDTCWVMFPSLAAAEATQQLAQAAFADEASLRQMITIARDNGLED